MSKIPEEKSTLRKQPRMRVKKIIPEFQAFNYTARGNTEVLIDPENENKDFAGLPTNKKILPYRENFAHRNRILKAENDSIKEEVEIPLNSEKQDAKTLNFPTTQGSFDDKKLKIGTFNDIELKKSSESSPNKITLDKIVKKLNRRNNENGDPINNMPKNVSQPILDRFRSIIEASKEKTVTRTKIEIEKSELTLNNTFKGQKLVGWFEETYKEFYSDDGKLLNPLALLTCVSLFQIGVIEACDEKEIDKFDINSLYKWSKHETPKLTPTLGRKILEAPTSNVSSELCKNCNRSLNNVDDVSFDKTKEPKLESESIQTPDDEKPKVGDIKKDETENSKTVTPALLASMPPSPPLIPGSNGPPPPPLIPGNGSKGGPPPPLMVVAQSSRKPVVKPVKPMRVLHWNRIIVPENISNGEKGKFWLQISEQKLDNIENFVELFNTEKKHIPQKVSKPKKETLIKVLDGKRSLNVGIAIRKLDIEDIKYALFNCKITSQVQVEELMNIEKLKATDEELMKLQNVKEIERLDKPEAWLLNLSLIDSLSERIFCIVTKTEFEDNIFQVSHKLSLINSLSNFFIENENLKKLISIILTLGNYLNGGNAQKGQADGFGLEILGKLKDVKSNDPKTTLLHFVVKTYIAKESVDNCPVPEPSEVEKASSADFLECENDLSKLKIDVQKCKNKLKTVILKGTSGKNLEIFKTTMENFIFLADKRITNKQQELQRCKVTFQKAVDQYSLILKNSADVKNPGQFFDKWTKFVTDFYEIYKAEVSVIREKLEKYRKQNQKNVQIRMSVFNSLQAIKNIIEAKPSLNFS